MAAAAGIIVLYCVAMVVAIVSRRLRVPYTAALLVVGVALGAAHVAALPHLTRELLFAVFLPGLLFEAAYHIELYELRENAWTIGLSPFRESPHPFCSRRCCCGSAPPPPDTRTSSAGPPRCCSAR
jgi:NhaP-type Na+/H+ and K+/H+ antiporters